MRTSVISSRLAVFGALLALACLSRNARAANGAWTGAQDAYWTNNANWTSGAYPVGGQAAAFTNAGNAQTTINVAGLASASNIVFDTADVAAYTIGASGANQQTLVMLNGGLFQLTSSAANNQRFDAAVTLGTDKNTGSYGFRNDKAGSTLTFAGSVAGSSLGSTAGGKTLSVDGAGETRLLGNITPGGASSLTLNANGTGNLTLSGTNTLFALYMNGAGSVIDIGAGQVTFTGSGGNNLVASQNTTINGTGSLVLSTAGGENYADNAAANGKTLTINARVTGNTGFEYWSGNYFGTIVLNADNDFASNILFNAAGSISVSKIGNKYSTNSNCGKGTSIIFRDAPGGRLIYTGAGEATDRIIDMRNNGIVEMAGSGTLNFSTPPLISGTKTLTLQGSTAGTGEFSGALNGALSIIKQGSGAWVFSTTNAYTGTTAVNEGTLSLSGALGSTAAGCTGYSVSNSATLRLYNTSAANNTNRLRDAAAIAMSGGMLSLAHDGSAASYLENAGALTVYLGSNTVSVDQAPEGQTAALRLASLSRFLGTLNFVGAGLGESDRCRVFIAGQAPGLLGAWASVNGTSGAAYDAVKGVYLPSGIATTDIAAKGPTSVIPNDAGVTARINLPGESGPITLAGEWTNSIYTVVQNTPTNAVIATRDGATNKTLLTSGLLIGAGMASVTVGETTGDGALGPLSAGGNLLLQNDEPAATLTLNTPVVNYGSASALSKFGAGPVILTASNSYSGVTAIYDGALTFGGSVTQTLSGTISGAGALVKQDSGMLILAGANTFSGQTTIKAGTVVAQNSSAFGGTLSGTVVEAGATLEVGSALAADSLYLGAEPVTVSGDGVAGLGAIVNSSPRQQFHAFGKIALADDASFGGVSRWDLRESGPTLALNGHKLKKVGSNNITLVGTAVTPGAGTIDVLSGVLQLETTTKLNGSAANTFRVRSGARMAYWYLDPATNATPWSLILDDGSGVVPYGGLGLSNTWSGPVTLNGTTFFEGSSGTSSTFSGPITNSGSVVKTGSGSVTYLMSSNNAYSGSTIVSNGTLYAKYPGSIPGYNAGGRVAVVGGGTLNISVYNGTYGWTADQIGALTGSNLFTAADAVLGVETFGNLDHPYSFPGTMGITKSGNGILNIPDGQSLISQVRVNGGELVLDNLSVNVSNKTCIVGDASTDFGKLTLGGTALWFSHAPGKNDTSAPLLYVGNSGRGILAVKDSAVLTNRINVGNNAGSHGAIYQSGGSVVNWGGSSTDARLGQYGYGYYELSGGALAYKGWSQIGCNPSGVGILRVCGGSFTQRTDFDGNLGICRGGTGVVHVTSGLFTTLSDLLVGDSSENSTSGGFAEFTVAGGLAAVGGSVKMADRANMKASVALNGGTFRARTAGALFGTGTAAPDAVSVYAGGAIFDTTNLTATVPVPLLAPAGGGVSSVSVSSRGGYIGPPFVTLSGGGGTGATAVAQFDAASGTLTGITVTCPGFGYTGAPTVTLSGGGTNVHPAATASISANVGGGLTKLGSGTLVLSATNTYAGSTVVSNGMLRLGIREAIPAASPIWLAGGGLDLGSFAFTNLPLNLISGSVVNGSLTGTAFTKTGAGTLVLGATLSPTGTITVQSGALKLQSPQPGLYENAVAGAFNTTDSGTNVSVQLATRFANQTTGWPDNTTYIYSGFIWNRNATNVTWTFAENFDDNVMLTIDGSTLIANGVSWNVPTKATYTLTPGAHPIEMRFGQGTGGAGPVNSDWWKTTAIGFGVDYLGRDETNVANYVALTDPGNGSLLTLYASTSTNNLIETSASVALASGTALDLGGMSQSLAGLSGSGTVSNGTLAVTGTLAPGGTNVIGTLSLAAASALSGTLLIDVATDGSSDVLAVAGNISLSSLALEIANPSQLNHQKTYTVLTCTGTRTGAFSSVTVPSSHWRVLYRSDGSAQLLFVDGTLLKVK